MIPPSSLLKPAPTDLYTEIEERIPQKLQIIRISQISQYTEVKSENSTKKSKDLQGFHQYMPEYSENKSKCVYIPVTYFKNRIPNKYRPLLSSKTRKYTICITFGSQHIYIEN